MNFEDFNLKILLQVGSISDESPDYNWLYVRDGTIFTLEKRTDGAGSKRRHSDPPRTSDSPTYGFTALIVLNADQWRQAKSMKVTDWTTKFY
jgi:hypothetical protein